MSLLQLGIGTTSKRRGRRHHMRQHPDCVDDVLVVDITSPPVQMPADGVSCIDLTREDDESGRNFTVDLTNANDVSAIATTPRRRTTRTSIRVSPYRIRHEEPSDDMARVMVASMAVDPDFLPQLDESDLLPFFGNIVNGHGSSNRLQEESPVAAASSSTKGQGAESPESKITCPICFDSESTIKNSGRQLMSTNCGHVFCGACIRSAISAQKKCPTCRKKLTVRQIHPIFL